MQLLYSLSIYAIILSIRIASWFNTKAQQSIEGRKNWRKKLNDTIKNTENIIWIHVSSLGEFEQARPLIVQIKQQYPEYKILITFFSPSGYNARKNFEYADYVFYLPYDTFKNAQDFLNIVKPKWILFVKYEFWINFLNAIIQYKTQNNAKCFLISSIFRKHQPFFKWYGKIFTRALSAFDIIFVQDQLSVKLLKKLGFNNNVYLSGDTRIDRVIEIAQQTTTFPLLEKFCKHTKNIICGSTWDQDEKIIVPALKKLSVKYKIKIVIAPHHPDERNISKLIHLLKQYNLSYCRYTNAENTNDEQISNANVLIIDTIGILNKVYKYGYIAYVGGGFTNGIHNILEPAVYGLPVLFGIKYQKFYEATELIKTKGAYCIKNEKEALALFEFLLNNQDMYNLSKQSVLQFINKHKGGVDRTMKVLEPYFKV